MTATFTTPLCISSSHPSLPGHFPGAPIVPGVVILDHVARAIAQHRPDLRAPRTAPAIKFLASLWPDEAAEIRIEFPAPDTAKFTVMRDATVLVSGSFTYSVAPPPS